MLTLKVRSPVDEYIHLLNNNISTLVYEKKKKKKSMYVS